MCFNISRDKIEISYFFFPQNTVCTYGICSKENIKTLCKFEETPSPNFG